MEVRRRVNESNIHTRLRVRTGRENRYGIKASKGIVSFLTLCLQPGGHTQSPGGSAMKINLMALYPLGLLTCFYFCSFLTVTLQLWICWVWFLFLAPGDLMIPEVWSLALLSHVCRYSIALLALSNHC